MTFTSSSKTRHTSRCLHQRLLPVGRSGRAFARRPWLADRSPSASSSLDPSPLLGLSKDRPFVDIRFERPLPGVRVSAHARLHSLPSVRICHVLTRSALAVPPGFDGLLRSSAAGLFHPAADHGVHYVSSGVFGIVRCFPPDCSSLPLDLSVHSRGFPAVYDPGVPTKGHPSKVSPSSRPCCTARSGRHRKMLHDSTSARVLLGSPPRAFAQTSLRFRLTGLMALAFRRLPFDLSPWSSGAGLRPPRWPDSVPSPHAVAALLRIIRLGFRLEIALSTSTWCGMALRVAARPQGVDP